MLELLDEESEIRAALEQLVLDTENFAPLKNNLSEFNVFEAIGSTRSELRHSYFLAFLLDPNGSHKLGGFILRLLVQRTLSAIPEKLRTNQKFLKNSNPFVKFSKKEIEEGNNYLEKNFINKNDKIVVFCSRTPIYRSESYISVRNSNIKNQMMSMNFVIDNNYKAVRVGRDKINKFEINNKNFFDYTFADQQSDFLDLFIISKAKFMVCGNTGVNEIATIMRIPRLIVDFSNFNFLYNFNEAFTPIILPKKLFSKSLKRYLNFKEIFEKKLFDVNIISEIPNDIQLIDNSEDEILEATKEMKELVENKLDLNTERIKQGNFWNLYAKFYGVKEGMIISPNFFKKNNKLFI